MPPLECVLSFTQSLPHVTDRSAWWYAASQTKPTALTSISVVGQPSVLYLRRSQPSSRYQPSRPCSLILASTSSSVYGLSLSFTTIAIASLKRLHQNAAVDVDGLTGDERRPRRGEPERGRGDVLRPAPTPQRRGVRDRAAELAVGFPRKARLDPARAEHVDTDLGREAARQAFAIGQHAALDGAE